MIDKGYVLMMARYNAWQNNQLMAIVKGMKKTELTRDRGAFFGSILGTLSHLLWGDTLWMSRFCTDVPAPEIGQDQTTTFTPSADTWQGERFRMDGRMLIWAQTLRRVDLQGDLRMYSRILDREMVRPISLCVAHMFNHQTHHRGQVHAMLTAAGQDAPVTDIIFMPEED